MSCGVGHRHSSDTVLLCLWYRSAAIVLIQFLAWEPPYAEGGALKKRQKKKKDKMRGVHLFPFMNIKAIAGLLIGLVSVLLRPRERGGPRRWRPMREWQVGRAVRTHTLFWVPHS